jgi:hypothetical protein
MEPLEDTRPFSHDINKRPNKGQRRNSFSRRHSHAQQPAIQPNKTTGISKQVIPANQLKNPTWDPVSRQWIEGIPPTSIQKRT